MKVILLEKVHNVGVLGDEVDVRNGYARNYLIPQGKAVQANKQNLAVFQQRRAELEALAARALEEAAQRATQFADLVVTIQVQAADEGRLYGSVSVREITEALNKMGKAVEKREVFLPEGAIRQTGEYAAQLYLHTDVMVPFTVNVIPS